LVIAEVYHELLRKNTTAEDTLRAFDPSGDGVVSFQEFMQLITELSNGSLTQPQVGALCRTVFTHAQDGGLCVREFLSRFTVAFVQSKGMLPGGEEGVIATLAPTVEQIGKLIVRSRRGRAPLKNGLSMLTDDFVQFDDSADGFLQVDEFVHHVRTLPGFSDVRHDGRPLDDEKLLTIARAIADSYSNDGTINLLEFAQAFAVVDSSGNTDLADDVHEHILTFLFRHRHALRAACAEHDEDNVGHIGREHFAHVLEALNVATSLPEIHLTGMQMDALVESIAEENGTIEYEAFLSSFEVVVRTN